jgi:hypothetical protein
MGAVVGRGMLDALISYDTLYEKRLLLSFPMIAMRLWRKKKKNEKKDDDAFVSIAR